MAMMTIVDEVTDAPLGTLKKGKPRRGDTVWVDNAPYDVVDRERDVVVVRSRNGRYTPNYGHYDDNYGYDDNPENPQFPEDVPQYQRGPVMPQYPPRGGYAPPGWCPPGWQPGPYGAGVAAYPQQFMIYHWKFRVPIFSITENYPPQPGTEIPAGRFRYRVMGNYGDAVFVEPIPTWEYVVLAFEKKTGKAVLYEPIHDKRDSSEARQIVNRAMADRGFRRKQYHLRRKSVRTLTRYFRNPEDAMASAQTEHDGYEE